MGTRDTLGRFEESQARYARELEAFTPEQLKRRPGEDEWSLGQLYVHLARMTQTMHLRNIEACLNATGNATRAGGEKTEAGRTLFEQGGFPPVRVRVPPSPQYTPAEPESKEQLAEELSAVLRRMREIEPALAEADPNITVQHPRLGSLNAKEWFELIEMHYRHHFLQLERYKTFLKSE